MVVGVSKTADMASDSRESGTLGLRLNHACTPHRYENPCNIITDVFLLKGPRNKKFIINIIGGGADPARERALSDAFRSTRVRACHLPGQTFDWRRSNPHQRPRPPPARSRSHSDSANVVCR